MLSTRRPLGVAALVSTAFLGGCTLIADLSQSFEDAEGGAPGASLDAGNHDDDTADATMHPTTDASMPPLDGTTAVADGATPDADATVGEADAADAATPFAPLAGWQLDPTFAAAGWLVFDEALFAQSLPVLTTAPDGGLALAASFDDGSGNVSSRLALFDPSLPMLAPPSFVTLGDGGGGIISDISTIGYSLFVATNVDISMFNGAENTSTIGALHVTGPGGTATPTGVFSVSRFGPALEAKRIVGADSTSLYLYGDGPSDVGPVSATSFALPLDGDAGTATSLASSGGPPNMIADAVPRGGDLLTVGCFTCSAPTTGAFALVLGDGGIPSRSQFALDGGIAGNGTFANAVFALPNGGALVVGTVGRAFFAATTFGADGGTAAPAYDTPPASNFDIPDATAAIANEPTSRARIVTTSDGAHLVVAALSDEPALAVAVVDDTTAFRSDFAAAANRVVAPLSTAHVSLGSAVLVPAAGSDEYAYVAVAAVGTNGQRHVDVVRLLHHVETDASR